KGASYFGARSDGEMVLFVSIATAQHELFCRRLVLQHGFSQTRSTKKFCEIAGAWSSHILIQSRASGCAAMERAGRHGREMWRGGGASLLATYAALLLVLSIGVAAHGADVRKFALAFTVVFAIAYASWIVGS